jgi:hypothetical protein
MRGFSPSLYQISHHKYTQLSMEEHDATAVKVEAKKPIKDVA